jgi:hypothetical protein
MLVAGLAWGWRAPLGWDEQKYYLPAAQWFAERGFALDYPMPMPPLPLVVQGFVYRLTESVFVLRMLSTLFAIGATAVVASMTRDWRLVLMFGAFPFALMNAFTLKHHSLVLLCCVGALALFERKRIALAALVLAVGALTHQLTGAMIGTLVVISLLERRIRDACVLAASALPLAALVLYWRGARPPMHAETFIEEPVMSGLQPVQLLVLLFVAGSWIAPAVRVRWKAALLALPLTAAAMHLAGLMQPASVYERIAGPVSSAIYAATRGYPLPAAVAAGALAALGVALYAGKRVQLAVWSAMYGLVMVAVPYFFESYYALFVTVAWVLLRREIEERPSWFPLAATLAGIGYVIAKAV